MFTSVDSKAFFILITICGHEISKTNVIIILIVSMSTTLAMSMTNGNCNNVMIVNETCFCITDINISMLSVSTLHKPRTKCYQKKKEVKKQTKQLSSKTFQF